MPSPYDLARTQMGRHEVAQRAALQDYLKTGGANLDPATIAWCAAFVNSTLAQSGIKGSGSNLARSLLNVGVPVDTPQRGDIAVFSRGNPNGPYGHVGFFDSIGPDGRINVLGGNQGDGRVSLEPHDARRLLGYRRVNADGTVTARDIGPINPPSMQAAGEMNMAAPTAKPTLPQVAAGPMPAAQPAFGDVVAKGLGTPPVEGAAMPAVESNLAGVAQMFLANAGAEAQQKQQQATAEADRRRALFSNVGAMFGVT